MARVFLFGEWHPIDGQGNIARPQNPAVQGPWNAPLNTASGSVPLNAQLVIANLFHVNLTLTLRFNQDAAGDWRLAAQQPRQDTGVLRIFAGPPPAAGSTFFLRYGPLVFSNSLSQSSLSAAPDLQVSLGLPQPLTASDGLPLRIYYNGSVSLDLSAGAATLSAGTLRGLISSPFKVVVGHQLHDPSFFGQELAHPALTLPLASNPATLPLKFPAPGSTAPLVAHTDFLSRPSDLRVPATILGPLRINDYTLVADYTTGPGDVLQLATLTAMAASGNGGPELETHGWRDQLNQAVRWRASGGLLLHVRSRNDTSMAPGAFLLAPNDGGGIDALPTVIASAGAPGQAVIMHSQLLETKHSIAGPVRILSPAALRRPTAAPTADIDAGIASEATVPHLLTHQATHTIFIARTGHSYTPSTDTAAVAHAFPGTAVLLPLLPPVLMRASGTEADLINAVAILTTQKPSSQLPQATHESLMVEGPDTKDAAGPSPKLAQLFQTGVEPGSLSVPSIEPYKVARSYSAPSGATVTTRHLQPSGADYALIYDSAELDKLPDFSFSIASNATISVAGQPSDANGLPIALVKLSHAVTLAQIAAKEPNLARVTIGGQPLLDAIHPDIKSEGWVGIVLFNVPLNLDKFTILESLVGASPSNVTFGYIALCAAKNNQLSTTWRILYDATDGSQGPADPIGADDETRFLVKLIDIQWHDSTLLALKVKADLSFASFLKLIHQDTDFPVLEIDGAYDKTTSTVRFLGQLDKPLDLLPADHGIGPIAQVSLTGAEILVHGNPETTTIEIKGHIKPQNFSLGAVPFDPIEANGTVQGIDFDNLGIDLPTPHGSTVPGLRSLRINYPSLKLDLSLPSVNLSLVALKLQSLGIGGDGFDWARSVIWTHAPTDALANWRSALLMAFRLDLMSLPELSAVSMDRLSIDLQLALAPIDGKWDLGKAQIAFSALGFDHFDLDLMRFLRISADGVHLDQVSYKYPPGSATIQTASWLRFDDVTIEILGHTVVEGLELVIFTTHQGQTGFFCYLPNAFDSEILTINWVLVGNNITPDDGLAKRIMSIDGWNPSGGADDLGKQISAAIQPETLSILPSPGGAVIGDWVFAAGFAVFGDLLYGKFLFQDRRYYGIALGGGLLDEIFDSEFAISILYIKGPTPPEDEFVLSVRVPVVALPAFSFMGGVVTFDIAMNGSFLIDIGFPSLLPSGARDWSRCFGAIVTPFQGSGGLYVAKRTTVAANGQDLTLSGGYAVQFGLGASFGGGVFTVWVTVGLYAVLEGSFTFHSASDGHTNLASLQVVGAIGIVLRGVGELDWWIISIRIEVMASAEARTTLSWQGPSGPTLLQADFNLTVSASAQACIGGGWFRICQGISVSLSIPFHQQVKLG
jgi:hypothetical protein